MFSRTSGNITAAVILILLAGVQAQSVTLSSQSICAVTGSTVKISCSFTQYYSSSIREREWSLIRYSGGEKRVLKTDPEFSSRVSVSSGWNNCELTVRWVRVTDSGIYNFRFKTSRGDWKSAPSGVHLTVTDLQVKVESITVGQNKVKLTCSSSCSLGTNRYYNWYRNENTQSEYTGVSVELYSSYNQGRYSCGVYGSSHRSPSVCMFGKECWGVTYTRERVCALKGSSVDIFCSYKYPGGHTVNNTVWFIKQQPHSEPEDLREDEEYQGRVQISQISQNDSSMRINNLRESDAQTYRFKFYTDAEGRYTGEPGVTLSVTDLKITLSKNSYGTYLTCSSTCILTDRYTYIWYKNGEPVSNQHSNELYRYYSTVDAGSYSCAVRGYEDLRSPAVYAPVSPPVYSPRNTRAELVSSGEILEGVSVTLSCRSDADPPVLSYSWFNQREPADTPLSTVQNYTISNISSQDSGFYYCTAYNQLGHHNSTPIHLNVLYPPRNTRAEFNQREPADTPLSTVQNYTISSISSQNSGLYYCTAHNQLGHHNSTPIHLNVLYPPRPPSVSEHVSEDSVILVCVSDSNPPSSYTWYCKTGSDIILVGNSSSLTLTAGEAGLFFCKAENRLGSGSSSEWSATTGENTAVIYAASGVAAVLLLMFIAVCLWMRRKRGAERDAHLQSPNPADDTYTALNLANISSDYDTLQHVRDSPSDTYSALNPTTISSDYDTLQAVRSLHSKNRKVQQRRSSAADPENVQRASK